MFLNHFRDLPNDNEHVFMTEQYITEHKSSTHMGVRISAADTSSQSLLFCTAAADLPAAGMPMTARQLPTELGSLKTQGRQGTNRNQVTKHTMPSRYHGFQADKISQGRRFTCKAVRVP